MIDLDAFYKSPEDVAKSLAQNVCNRRKRMKLSQKELSEKSGVSYASLRRFENTGEISLKHLLAIATVLDELDEFEKLFTVVHYTTMEDFLNG